MRENELDLDAILAEYHAEERRPAAPAESPAPRRRRAESAPVPQEEPIASPAPQQPQQERIALTAERPAAPRQVQQPRPVQKPRPAPKAERERRPASRKSAGGLRMAVVLAALLAVLAGMLFWVSREEQKTAAQEPEPIRMELGQALENYLDHAATTSYG